MTRDELIEVMAKNISDAPSPSDYARAIATHALSAIEAAGFVIVPVVASATMELAGAVGSYGWADESDAAAIYTAMIQAAQEELTCPAATKTPTVSRTSR